MHAREETGRFRLPAALSARIATGNVVVPSENGSRKRARLAAEKSAENVPATETSPNEPDGGHHASGDTITPERKEA